MASFELSKILGKNPNNLTEQEKEDVYFELSNIECSPSIPKDELRALFSLAQEVLKFKGIQVDSLMSEIENLAARQGEEEEHRHQALIEEIEILQDQIRKTQKYDSFSGNTDEVKNELLKAEIKIDQLIAELQAKERELLKETSEVEKLTSQVMVLEQEKGELRGELTALQRESIEQQDARLQTESPPVKQRELVNTIRHKNKHITQLLLDIETVEKENNLLKLKVAGLQNDATDKGQKVILLSEENLNLKNSVAGYEEQVKLLEEKYDGLKTQLIEMVEDKDRRDDQLDQLGIALDSRLAQWQELLVQKDTELIELRQKLSQITAQFPNSFMDSTKHHLANMAQSLENREEQIEELQQQLAQANFKISELKETIYKLKSQLKSKSDKKEESPRFKRMKHELMEAQNKLKTLESRVTDAEKDAEVKAEEMTEMVIQLREYETGVFGLPDAMEQIKELQKQKKVRDRHIEQLIQAGNQLQADANLLEEENLALRERLGLDVDAVVRVDGVLSKYKADQTRLSEITQQLESANDTQITLKVQNRMYKKIISRLKGQLKKLGFEPETVSSEDDSARAAPPPPPPQPPVVQGISEETKAMLIKEAEVLENKLQDVIDENEALRKGMHEILDCVRSHDGTSPVQIESACLERLLEALDSRHVSGWYHPAMRLQAQLQAVEGNNTALREQIRITRFNEHEAVTKLHKALIQVDILQAEVQRLMAVAQVSEADSARRDSQLRASAKAIEFIDILKTKKEPVIQDLEKGKDDSSKLQKEYSRVCKKLSETETAMAEQKELFESDKESWLNVRKGLQSEIDSLSEKVASLSAEVQEYSTNWKAVQSDPDTVKSSLASATLKLADVCSENERLKRKCSVVQELELQSRKERDNVQEELISLQSSSSQTIQELKREKIAQIIISKSLLGTHLAMFAEHLSDRHVSKDKVEDQYTVLQKIHSECFAVSELEETQAELKKLTVKHRELLLNKSNEEETSNQIINQLRQQLEIVQSSYENMTLVVNGGDKVPEKVIGVISNKQKEDLNEEIKSHADKMYKLAKDQLSESEERCRQLERQLASLVQQNLSSQLVEAELRDQLVNSVPHSQLMELKQRLAQADTLITDYKSEVSELEEKANVAEEKAKALEELRHCHDYQHDALQRQVLELTASSEDKVTIGRLTRELLRTQESELAFSKQVLNLKKDIQWLENIRSSQDKNLHNLSEQYLSEKKEMTLKYRWLARAVTELHQRYLGHLSLLTAESLQAMLSQAHFEKTNTLVWASSFVNTDSLVDAIKNKFAKTDGSAASKVQELKLKVNVQALESQLNQTEGQLKRIEKLSSVFQEELLNQEKSWEKKQLVWEQELLKQIALSNQQEEKTETKVNETELSQTEDVNVTLPPVNAKEPSSSLSPDSAKQREERETMTSPRLIDSADVPVVVESESIKTLNNQLNQVTLVMNEQMKKLNHREGEITELRNRLDSLKKQLDDRDRKLQQKDKELFELQTSMHDKDVNKLEEETTEILALKATVASLQNIVNQKEETIGRYQTLLQECRDEHGITVANLQQELTTLQQSLEKKDSSVKEKPAEGVDKSSAMKVILERYLARVSQLEDDLTQCRDQTSRLAVELSSSQQQTEKWTHTAEERLKTIQEMKQRLDSARSKEDLTDTNSELMEKNAEIDELNKIVCNLKTKVEIRETVSATRDRLRGELDRANKRIDVIQTQNTELKAEVQRLRKQLTIRQASTPKSEAVSTAREEALQKKIKTLEEQVSEYQVVIQKGKEIHKSKCDDEFVKWEEKKRWQNINDKLKSQLKEKSSQVEALRSSVERLKETIIRLEKEKITLEGKLKNTRAPGVSENLVDELEKDRAKLQEEVRALRISTQLKSQQDTSLADVVEAQERRIATLKVAQKGEAALAEEVERLLERKSRLQQTNLRLEAQNLELKMQLEKYRLSELTPRDSLDMNSETESVGGSPKSKSKLCRNKGDLERAVVVLKRVVEKLQAENKRLHAARLTDVHDKGYLEKLQIELQRCQESYLDAMDRCSSLEEELKQCKDKLSIYEKDDLVEELALTKAQLAQKCQLLSKVKVLLENAVIREKALKEQVQDLEKLVPPERLRGTYHERKF